jgi:hypothetical protein
MPISHGSFYEDARYCGHCKQFVPYLLSPGGVYCVLCDRELSLSSRRMSSGPAFRVGPGTRRPATRGSTGRESTLPSGRR